MTNLFFAQLINSLIQVILATLIPFIVWFISQLHTKSKSSQSHPSQKVSFLSWLGIKTWHSQSSRVWPLILVVSLIFAGISIGMLKMVGVENLANSPFQGLGLAGIPVVLLYAFIQTGLSEEILFRGFILKRLLTHLDFFKANFFQALLFGTLHGLLLISSMGIYKALLVILFTGSIGFFMGFINEKKANGSILPSWLIHGIANVFSSTLILLNLLS